MPCLHYLLKRNNLWPHLKALLPGALRPAPRKLAFCSTHVEMTTADRRYLVGYYREDILRLAAPWDRDLTAWLH